MEAYDSYEHAGVMVEIVQDCDPMSPQDNDNAGTLYSWTRDFDGDERIGTPDMEVLCPTCQGEALVPTRYWPGADWTGCLRCDGGGTLIVDYDAWFAEHHDAALTVPLWYDNYGSRGSRLYESDDPNCALCFTQKEIDYEWSGHLDPYPWPVRDADGNSTGEMTEGGGARAYAQARINELDQYFSGNVWGIVIRHEGEVLESVWGFIDEPDGEYIRQEAEGMAEAVAASIRKEAEEVAYWATRDVVTVG